MKGSLATVHPFPARMASSIVFDELLQQSGRKTVVDPMAGSGTSLVAARIHGHKAIGFDIDPLAVLIADAWTKDFSGSEFSDYAKSIVQRANKRHLAMKLADAYPIGCDKPTKKYIRFWFDATARRQLAALSATIQECPDTPFKVLLWCAFSRLIITKANGVSRAMDVSHSRPHRVYRIAPIKPFDAFESAVKRVIKGSPFSSQTICAPNAEIRLGDARKLPLRDNCADLVISSPPYLNAIDYVRGHRLSLVWMGHTLSSLQLIRRRGIGSDSYRDAISDQQIERVLSNLDLPTSISSALRGILVQYVRDMTSVLSEVKRILRPGGNAIFVVGDSTSQGELVSTSGIVRTIGDMIHLELSDQVIRAIPESRRYLPPPDNSASGAQMRQRMRSEVVLKFSNRKL